MNAADDVVRGRDVGFLFFLTLLNVMNFVDRQLLGSFANWIVPDLNLTNTEFGLLTGLVFIVFYSVMGLFMGALADTVNRTRLIAAGLALWSALTALSGAAKGFVSLAIPRMFIGVGESIMTPTAMSLLGDRFPSKWLGLASGVYYMGVPVGVAASLFIVAYLEPVLGWRGCFYALGAFGVLLAIIMLFMKETPRKHISSDPATGALVTPIHQTSTFVQDAPGVHRGFDYSRTNNPTRATLETVLAALEGVDHAAVFASGLAAENAVLQSLLRPGDAVLAPRDVYGGTYRLFHRVFARFGVTLHQSDLDDVPAGTRLVWVESPTNPRLQVFDLARVAGEEPVLTEGVLEGGVVVLEGAGEAQADGAGLAHVAAAVDADDDVELALGVRHLERGEAVVAVADLGEVLVDRLGLALVDRDGERAGAGLDPDAGDGGLAAAGAPDESAGVGLGGLGERAGLLGGGVLDRGQGAGVQRLNGGGGLGGVGLFGHGYL